MFLCKPCHDVSKETFAICAGLPSYGPCERCHKTTQTVDCHGNHNAALVAIRDEFLKQGEAKSDALNLAETEEKLLRYIAKLEQAAQNLCDEMEHQYHNAVMRIGSGGDDAKSVWAAKNDLRAVLKEKA